MIQYIRGIDSNYHPYDSIKRCFHINAFPYAIGLRMKILAQDSESQAQHPQAFSCTTLHPKLVFKAHRLLYHSTLGLRVIQKQKKRIRSPPPKGGFVNFPSLQPNNPRVLFQHQCIFMYSIGLSMKRLSQTTNRKPKKNRRVRLL